MLKRPNTHNVALSCIIPHHPPPPPPPPPQPSVPAWLAILGLEQYEQVLIDAGYDDIDFISDISPDELQDIGIIKKGG